MSETITPFQPIGRQINVQQTTVTPVPTPVATALLTGTAATLYTAPSTSTPIGSIARAKLHNVTFCNTDSSARTITLYLVASGGSAGTSNTVIAAASIPAGKTWTFDAGAFGIPLANGETIQGKASVTSVVTYRISVEEFL